MNAGGTMCNPLHPGLGDLGISGMREAAFPTLRRGPVGLARWCDERLLRRKSIQT